MINIYHYSNKDFKGYIKPDFFGNNSYTLNSGRVSGINRSYFYIKQNRQEYHLKYTRYLYIASIDLKKLYNIDKNILKFNSQEVYTQTKKLGYIGICNQSQVVLFKAIKINNKTKKN